MDRQAAQAASGAKELHGARREGGEHARWSGRRTAAKSQDNLHLTTILLA
jgi:hypothetical protein